MRAFLLLTALLLEGCYTTQTDFAYRQNWSNRLLATETSVGKQIAVLRDRVHVTEKAQLQFLEAASEKDQWPSQDIVDTKAGIRQTAEEERYALDRIATLMQDVDAIRIEIWNGGIK